MLKAHGLLFCGRDCRGGGAVPELCGGMKAKAGTPKSPVFVQLSGTKSHPDIEFLVWRTKWKIHLQKKNIHRKNF
mgnify:CR=1 FL=1